MFRDPKHLKIPEPEQAERAATGRVGRPQDGAVGRLAKALDELVQANPGRYSITLVGHSMGTIVANEVIRTHPTLPLSNIVYMAAACSVSEFSASVIPYLRDATNAHFYNLSLHPLAEEREAQWKMVDLPPRGSLLEWIDNFFSTPRTIPERTLGKWLNITATTALIPTNAVSSRVVLKSFSVGLDGQISQQPQVHGEFSEMVFWDENFWSKPAR
jgi:pimeloyl-ACP methyl ester carboxylesterase